MNKKRILIAVTVVAVMLVGGITAGTTLEIQQPASTQIIIEGIGGSSPTFNLVDNPGTTAGGKAGEIADDDTYVIDFGPDGAGVIFGRNQEVWIGSTSDPIFTLENNYSKGLIIRPEGAGAGPNVNGLGFFLQMRSGPPPYLWHFHPGVWVTPWNKIVSLGWDWIPAGASFSYSLHYRSIFDFAQPENSFTLPLKLCASENNGPLSVWSQKYLPPNDVVFDDVNQVVYHKTQDGSSVEAIPFADFDYDAWVESMCQGE